MSRIYWPPVSTCQNYYYELAVYTTVVHQQHYNTLRNVMIYLILIPCEIWDLGNWYSINQTKFFYI